jgi:threonine/homoserine/homoserine lactone efflux protein
MIALDLASGVLGIVGAGGAFMTHIVSNPRRRLWLRLPGYVRLPLGCAGSFLLFRGVDLCWRSEHPGGIGHVDLVGFGSWLTIAWFFIAFALLMMNTQKLKRQIDRMMAEQDWPELNAPPAGAFVIWGWRLPRGSQ